tara:strand:- start:578 stop:730 length:153 start_codon:yes stop_codon:yes gene_type:complete
MARYFKFNNVIDIDLKKGKLLTSMQLDEMFLVTTNSSKELRGIGSIKSVL